MVLIPTRTLMINKLFELPQLKPPLTPPKPYHTSPFRRSPPAMAEPPATVTIAKAAYRIQLSLFEGASCTDRQLLVAADILSQPDYEDVIVERTIDERCGYPRCPNPLPPGGHRKAHFRIALSEHRVYDLHETYKYCSSECLVSSRAFSESLPKERVSKLSSAKIEQVLGLFQSVDSSGEDLGVLSNLMIQEKGSAPASEVSIEQWIGPSNAIEGYVPQRERNQGTKISSDKKPVERAEDYGYNNEDFMSTIVIDGFTGVATSTRMKDVTERISKQLEDVVTLEKKRTNKGKKTSPKSSKSKSTQKAADSTSGKLDSRSNAIVKEHAHPLLSKASSVLKKKHLKQLDKGLKDEVRLEKSKKLDRTPTKEPEDWSQTETKAESKEAALKSSMRTSGSSKSEGRSVRWADERTAGDTTGDLKKRMEGLEINDSSQVSQEEDVDNALRLASAEACAEALIQAADAVAFGDSDYRDLASDAGILILPQLQNGNKEGSEADDMFGFDRGFMKWPKKPVLLETDMFEVEDSWHDAPPEGFNLTLSSFATMWTSLFSWITCSSLAHIYGHDESSQYDFLVVNGREYPHKIVLGDGKSSEIRQTVDGCISRALPGLVWDIRLQTPVSTLERAVGRLLDTMSFVDALPGFRTRQWHVIVFLFLEALSVHRLPVLSPHMTNKDVILHKRVKFDAVRQPFGHKKRGISNFYCGKSKSFTSLTDAVSASSVKDIAKPEDPYTRKRKNLFALSSTMRDRARSHDDLLRSIQGSTGFFAKRPANSSRSTCTMAASTSSSGSNSSSSEEEHEPVRRLPPLHPRSKPVAAAVQSGTSPDEKLPLAVRSRSLSLADLRGLPTTSASD